MGPVDGFTMTNLFVVVGQAVGKDELPNTLILNYPEKPFANLGFHQETLREIDLEFCAGAGIDVVRRMIGGGAILDGPWEQDYMIVVKRNSSECPVTIPDVYKKFLAPTVYVLKTLGLNAEFRGLNDVSVGQRKISANGAVEVDGGLVLAGDILLDLDIDLMSRVLKVPDEKFRDKVAGSMREWLTSLRLELNDKQPSRERVIQLLLEGFRKELGVEFEEINLPKALHDELLRRVEESKDDDWIFMKERAHDSLFRTIQKCVKIKEGLVVCRADHKAQKLIRITVMTERGVIREIQISGDFFTVPFDGAISELEKRLVGMLLDEGKVRAKVQQVFEGKKVSVFGATVDDFVQAVMKAKDNPLVLEAMA